MQVAAGSVSIRQDSTQSCAILESSLAGQLLFSNSRSRKFWIQIAFCWRSLHQRQDFPNFIFKVRRQTVGRKILETWLVGDLLVNPQPRHNLRNPDIFMPWISSLFENLGFLNNQTDVRLDGWCNPWLDCRAVEIWARKAMVRAVAAEYVRPVTYSSNRDLLFHNKGRTFANLS